MGEKGKGKMGKLSEWVGKEVGKGTNHLREGTDVPNKQYCEA
jgi:hypothetical protein